MPRLEIEGQTFSHLTAIKFSHIGKYHKTYWLFKCSCGYQKILCAAGVKNGDTKSCGCAKKDHGLESHPLYVVWTNMKNRCYKPAIHNYKSYGGRGITICNQWLNSVEDFYTWAVSNGWRKGLLIDRVNNDLGYSPDNCRFVTASESACNKREADSVGVQRRKGYGHYRVRIRYHNNTVLCKTFKTFNAAATARNNFIIKNNLPHQLTKLKEAQMDIDRIVEAYVACRDKLAEIRKEFKQTELEHKSQMALMETAILNEADKQGVESFKTKHGTAFKTKKDFISVENWPAALDHMIANDLTHLLTKSVGKAAAKEYMAEQGGALPPGLKYGYIPAISIRRK